MSRTTKISIIIICLIIISIVLYVLMKRMNEKGIYDCIPENSLVVLTLENPMKVWQEFESSNVWAKFKHMKFAQDLRLSMEAANKSFGNERNRRLLELIFDEQIAMASNDMGKFALYADIGLKSDLVRFVNMGKNIFVKDSRDIRYNKETVNGRTINIVELLVERKIYAYTIIRNILILGDDVDLVRTSVMAADNLTTSYSEMKEVRALDDRIKQENKVRMYLNVNQVDFDEFMTKSVHPIVSEIVESMSYLGVGLDWDTNGISLRLYGPMQAGQRHELLSKINEGSRNNIPPIALIPGNANNVISFRMGDLKHIWKFTEEQVQRDHELWTEYQRSRDMVETDFGISIDDYVLSWLGESIGAFTFESTSGGRVHQVLWIEARDPEKAKQSLEKIKAAIEKKFPIVFKDRMHRGVAISYIDLPLYLKIILNPIFERISKPYWMIVDDKVLFSDDINVLVKVVDTYKSGESIEANRDFELIERILSFDSNIFLYGKMIPSIRYIKGFLNRSAVSKVNNLQPYLHKFESVGVSSNVKKDLITARLYLKLGKSEQGSIQLRWKIETGGRVNCPITCGEFDSHRGDEIIIADDSGKLQVVTSEANAVKGWPRYFESEIKFPIGIGDMDDDGKDDLVVISKNKVYILDRSGNRLNRNWPMELDGSVSTAPVLDRIDNKDGDELLIITDHKYFHVLNERGEPVTGWPVITEGPLLVAPAVGDIDDDDSNEIVINTANGFVYVFEHDGKINKPWPISINSAVNKSPTLADMDGDGMLDIIVVTLDGKIFIFSKDGARLEGWPVSVGTMISGSAVIGDVDADGRLDIVFGAGKNKVHLMDSQGRRFDNWPRETIGAISTEPVLGDVNGDGAIDIVITSDDGKLYAWDSAGKLITGWPLQGSESPALGDFNADGLIDIVSGSWDGYCYYWELNKTFRKNSVVWAQYRHDKANSGALDSR